MCFLWLFGVFLIHFVVLCVFFFCLCVDTAELNRERIETSEQFVHQVVNIEFYENSDSELSEIEFLESDSELSSYLGSSEGYKSGEDASSSSV